MLKVIRGILFLLLFSAVFNLFLTPGHIVLDIGILTITKEGIIKEMRHYYALLPVKPEWCTKEDIDNYERNIF